MKYLSSPKKIAEEVQSLKFTNRNSLVSLAFYLALILSLLYPFFQPKFAGATITQAFVRMDRHSTGAAISGSACMETASSHGTETNVTIVFPSDWTVSSTPSNWVANSTNLPYDPTDTGTQATMWAGVTNSEAATSVSGTSVTWTATDLSDSTFYCFNFTGTSSTIGAAGDNKVGAIQVQGGSPFVSNVAWATDVVTSNADQITVTASVSASLTFSLSGNSVALGTLSSSGTTYDATGITESIATNARNGWVSWVKSANAGLDSATASDSIDSAAWTAGAGNIVDTASVAGYVLDMEAGTGTPTIATEYNGDGNSSGGNLDTQFRQIASRTVPTSGDTAILHIAARSSADTAAASDYTDTLTVVAAGSF